MVAFISNNTFQLLVGPASASSTEQMKVRPSTRATSPGSVRAQNELGLRAGSSRTSAPESTRASVRPVHSASDPSHQTIRSGVVRAATSSIHLRRRACGTGDLLRSALTNDRSGRGCGRGHGSHVRLSRVQVKYNGGFCGFLFFLWSSCLLL